MELGRVGFKERDVADLLSLYGVDDQDERDRLLTLARRGEQPRLVAPVRRRTAQLVPVVPGPGGRRRADPDVRGAVRPRPAADRGVRPGGRPARPRQRHAGGDRPPRRAAHAASADPRPGRARRSSGRVVDEAVLRRPIGGADVMRGPAGGTAGGPQPPNVRLQIIPFTAGGHSAAGGAFTILRFPDQDLPDVVYIEQLTSALYLDKRDDVDHYARRDGTPVCRGRPTRPHRRHAAQPPQGDLTGGGHVLAAGVG